MESYFYADENKRPHGPFTLEALRRLAEQGEVRGDTYVIREGESQWRTWVSLAADPGRGGGEAAEDDEEVDHGWVERANAWFAGFYSTLSRFPASWAGARRRRLRGYVVRGNRMVSLLILGLGLAAVGYGVDEAVKQRSTGLVFASLLAVPLAFVLQHVVSLFNEANLKLAFGEPIVLVSRMVPKIVTLGAVVAAAAWLIVGTVITFKLCGLSFLYGLGGLALTGSQMVLLLHIAWLAGSPEHLGIVGPPDGHQGAADYLCNLVRFFGRLLLTLVPVQVVAGTLGAGVFALLVHSVGDPMAEAMQHGGPLPSVGPLGTTELAIMAFMFFGTGGPTLLGFLGPVMAPVFSHVAYLFAVSLAEFGSGFFRLVENVRLLARRQDRETAGAADGGGTPGTPVS